MCGENEIDANKYPFGRGSPPRVRGKLIGKTVIMRLERITPACAGKTYCHQFRTRANWDHPRVCGENNRSKNSAKTGVGSPPRVRGKPGLLMTAPVLLRITPACAGKTQQGLAHPVRVEDHPRVCGENAAVNLSVRLTSGSPPRVRGKQAKQVCDQLALRITPACAGKT